MICTLSTRSFSDKHQGLSKDEYMWELYFLKIINFKKKSVVMSCFFFIEIASSLCVLRNMSNCHVDNGCEHSCKQFEEHC